MKTFLIKNIFKLSGYISLLYSILSTSIYKYINSIYPSYIINIKIINTNENTVTIYGNNLNLLVINNECYYIINIWNKKLCSINYFILNNKLLNNIHKHQFIDNILTRYSSLKNNNIYAIIICKKDVTHIFEKYLASISIPNNITAHTLYLYYCYKYHIQPTIHNSAVTIVDYDLNEKIFTYNEFIVCDN